MFISVIIPNFNDIRIERTLTSLRNQTYQNFEIIVVDGGSGKTEVLDIYNNHKIDTLIIENDNGIFDALNKGVKVAKGDLIYLMGSDDFLPSIDTFYNVIEAMNSTNSDGICIGCEFINSKGKVIRTWYPKSITSDKIKLGIFPPHFSLFLKKEVYNKVGDFQYKEFKNIACDIFWLLDYAILCPDLKISVNAKDHLKMEYGGSSTGSYKAVLRQFLLVYKYAKRNSKYLPFWFILSPIRTFSKIFQFKIF